MTLRNIISKLSEVIPGGVHFRSWWRNRSQAWQTATRRRRLRKFGPGILLTIHNLCRDLGVPYFIDYGTLLGFARDGGFIKHDDDIDLSILPGFSNKIALARLLLLNGFKFKRGFICESRLTEYAFERDGVSVDFFFEALQGELVGTELYATGGVIVGPNDKIRTISAVRELRAVPRGLHEVDFVGTKTMVPENVEELLENSYGPHWRTPIANWRPPKDDPMRRSISYNCFVVGIDQVLSGEYE